MYAGVPNANPVSVSRSAAGGVQRAGDPEVRHHGFAVGQQDVLRLDVAVDDSVAMGVVESIGDLARDPHGLVYGQLGLGDQPVSEGAALHEGHGVVEQRPNVAATTLPASWIGRMCGCASRPAMAISRLNRSLPSAPAISGRSTLSATSLSWRRSRAR